MSEDRSRRSVGNKGQPNRRAGNNLTGDGTHAMEEMSGSSRGSASTGMSRIQVNVALNEDLSCSYKISKMTACSVEGVIQVSTTGREK